MRAVRHRLPLGSIVAALVFTITSWPHAAHGPLGYWTVATIAVSLALWSSFTLSRSGALLRVALGAAWGSVLWLDLDVVEIHDSPYRWISLAALFCVSTALLLGLGVSARLSLSAIVPMWSVAAAAMYATGDLFVPTAMMLFLILVSREVFTAERVVEELHLVRSGAPELPADPLARKLRVALCTGQITAAAQPIFELSTRRVSWVELLARWELDGQSVPPSVFVPLAEEHGMLDDLTRVMLAEAVRARRSWRYHPHLADASVTVNVSPSQLETDRLLPDIARALMDHDIPPGGLTIELTDSSLTSDLEAMRSTLEQLRDLGVTILIDDFGSGLTAIKELLTLPMDAVKIDRSVIADLDGGDHNATVRSIADLARVIGHVVIAEGVETQAHADQLEDLDIDHAQGYLFCHPVTIDDLATMPGLGERDPHLLDAA